MNVKNPYSFLEAASKNFPDKLAIIYKERKYTYKEFYTLTNNIKSFFIKNTKLQEVVGLYMENSDHWLMVYFSILGSGCICCPFDQKISSESMIDKIKFIKPKYVVISAKYSDRIKRDGIDKFTEVIIVDDLIGVNINLQERDLEDAKYSTLMFTSGTTEKQKAIRLPSVVVSNATLNIVDYLKIRYEDVYYAILPFSHSFGIGNIHTIFKVGGSVIIADNTINLRKVIREITDFNVTFFAATPLTLKMIVENFEDEFILAGEKLRVICTNTGPMAPNISKRIIKNLKKTYFYTYYGLTEASRSTFFCFNLYPEKIESVGRPAPNVSISIVDKNFNDTPPQQIGEIFIKGNHVISEYWGDEEKTKNTFMNEGMLTGDIGYIDEEGFLYVVGRKDDLINIGGEKFSLLEVDNTIKELDIIEDAATILEEDCAEGHLKVFIILKPGKLAVNQSEAKRIIQDYCRKKLESYKVPREILFVDNLPRTDSGKLKRKEMMTKNGKES